SFGGEAPRGRRGDPRGAGDEADAVAEAVHRGSTGAAAMAAINDLRSSGVARTIAEPIPTAVAPASRNATAFVASTPPVTIVSTSGIGPRSSRTWLGPRDDAGKSFTNVAPARQAASISVGL